MEHTSAESVSPQTEMKGLSLKGLWEVFYTPSTFFAQLKQSPKILVPYVLLVILSALFFAVAADYLVQAQMASPQVQERLQGQEITPDMMAISKITTVVMGTIIMVLYPLLVAALALFFGNFVMAGSASYRQLLSVALYSGIIYAVGEVLILPLMIAKGSAEVSFSLAVLVADQGIMSPAYQALSRISVFSVWEFIAAAVGFSIIYGFSRNKGYVLAVLSIGLLSVVAVLWSVIGSML